MLLSCKGRWAWLTALFICPALAQPLPERLPLCAACHGEGGNSAIPGTPSLAGQPAIFLENQLVLLREGMREVPQMAGMLKDVSDYDFFDLAAYYVRQAAPRASGVADPE